mgnify:CR=1 FL=1
MYHDGTHTYVTNDSVVGSNLYIRNATNDADTIFQGDDGSGGLATYLTIDGSATRIVFLFRRKWYKNYIWKTNKTQW